MYLEYYICQVVANFLKIGTSRHRKSFIVSTQSLYIREILAPLYIIYSLFMWFHWTPFCYWKYISQKDILQDSKICKSMSLWVIFTTFLVTVITIFRTRFYSVFAVSQKTTGSCWQLHYWKDIISRSLLIASVKWESFYLQDICWMWLLFWLVPPRMFGHERREHISHAQCQDFPVSILQ